ncbi:MAG: hypothetical protein COB24_14030 [Hyphomicrobiales bacterium]|nr:MAG: hypothetical protein COB24_14030 [Hyphomicrobiales bacterium]
MDFNIFLLPAALFPAMPLMLISFGNRYSSMSSLIRKIHDELIDSDESKKTKSAVSYMRQIGILRKRLMLNRATQTLGALGFFINLVAMYSAFVNLDWFDVTFTIGMSTFGLSILLFIIEIQLATRALDMHLEDLEEL